MVAAGLGTSFKAAWCSGTQEIWDKFRPHPKQVSAASLSLRQAVTNMSA